MFSTTLSHLAGLMYFPTPLLLYVLIPSGSFCLFLGAAAAASAATCLSLSSLSFLNYETTLLTYMYINQQCYMPIKLGNMNRIDYTCITNGLAIFGALQLKAYRF